MRYYINGKKTTKEDYEKQKEKNARVVSMPLNTKEEREAFLREMRGTGFLTVL